MSQQPIILKAGLQFRSKTFADIAEIVGMDEMTDIVKVRRTPSDGNAYIVDWPLQATKDHFKQGFYFIPKPIPYDVTTW